MKHITLILLLTILSVGYSHSQEDNPLPPDVAELSPIGLLLQDTVFSFTFNDARGSSQQFLPCKGKDFFFSTHGPDIYIHDKVTGVRLDSVRTAPSEIIDGKEFATAGRIAYKSLANILIVYQGESITYYSVPELENIFSISREDYAKLSDLGPLYYVETWNYELSSDARYWAIPFRVGSGPGLPTESYGYGFVIYDSWEETKKTYSYPGNIYMERVYLSPTGKNRVEIYQNKADLGSQKRFIKVINNLNGEVILEKKYEDASLVHREENRLIFIEPYFGDKRDSCSYTEMTFEAYSMEKHSIPHLAIGMTILNDSLALYISSDNYPENYQARWMNYATRHISQEYNFNAEDMRELASDDYNQQALPKAIYEKGIFIKLYRKAHAVSEIVGLRIDDLYGKLNDISEMKTLSSVAEEPVSANQTIFPNPFQSPGILELGHINSATPFDNVKLYNATGNLILETPNSESIAIPELPNGVYHLVLSKAGTLINSHRFVIGGGE